MGSFLGAIIGWRGAFVCVMPLAALALYWQQMSLPALPSDRQSGTGNVLRLLGRPKVAIGMGAVLFLFMGQFALFTYRRPFLETVTRPPGARGGGARWLGLLTGSPDEDLTLCRS